MVADVATSAGDTLMYDSYTPGGYTLQGHSASSTSISKIASGNWDYVVLQEQSQRPSFPIQQVTSVVFPYAKMLDSTIRVHNPCGETVFYMTWGRKFGDANNCASWPPVCTYEGMDSLLSLRYRMMADSNDAIISPVGAVWKHMRQSFPLLNLYQSDLSHPSVAGTYAAACCFYTIIFRKDPSNITFNATLSATDAANIRAATKLIVYDSLLNWHVGEYDPLAEFEYASSGVNQLTFTNTSINASSFHWDFGDGDTSALAAPIHQYVSPGTYTVRLISGFCDKRDTTSHMVILDSPTTSIAYPSPGHPMLTAFPNPVSSFLFLDQLPSGKLTYQIVSISGEQVQVGTISDSERRIEVGPLASGVYFLVISDGKKILGKQKFLKTTN